MRFPDGRAKPPAESRPVPVAEPGAIPRVPADGSERTVFLKGNRLGDADEGARLTVTGRLRVAKHPAAVVGGVRVGAWIEVRVTEA